MVALLKPFQEPCYLRDYWARFKQKYSQSPKTVLFFISLVFLSTALEIGVDIKERRRLFKDVDSSLVFEYYGSKVSLCGTCFVMQAYLIVLIVWLVHFSIKVARLLEFELMCRHAVLTKDEGTEIPNNPVVMINWLDPRNERCYIFSDNNVADTERKRFKHSNQRKEK